MLEILDTAGTVSCTTIWSKLGGKNPILFSRTGFHAHVFLSNEQLAVPKLLQLSISLITIYQVFDRVKQSNKNFLELANFLLIAV